MWVMLLTIKDERRRGRIMPTKGTHTYAKPATEEPTCSHGLRVGEKMEKKKNKKVPDVHNKRNYLQRRAKRPITISFFFIIIFLITENVSINLKTTTFFSSKINLRFKTRSMFRNYKNKNIKLQLILKPEAFRRAIIAIVLIFYISIV